MWLWEAMSWVATGLVAGAVFTGLGRERRTRREMRIGISGAVVAGILARLADGRGGFSVVSLLAAVGGAGCALLLDWLNVEEKALEDGARRTAPRG